MPRLSRTEQPSDDAERASLEAAGANQLNLWRRIYLTYVYHGLGALILRAFTFPLRLTPLERHVRFGRKPKGDPAKALRSTAVGWYRWKGRPVTIVIPSYRDAPRVATLVESIRRTTNPRRVRIVVADDASGPEHVAALRQIPGIQVIEGETNVGFAANTTAACARRHRTMTW